MYEIPLQLIDDILRNYHVGHVILLLFVLAVVGGFVANRSIKVVGIQLSAFGLLFILTPNSMMPTEFLYLGIALVVVGPVVAISSNR
jgi:hypothetical protein